MSKAIDELEHRLARLEAAVARLEQCQPQESAPEWLGTPAAARYLGVRLRTLYGLVDEQGLPAYRVGRAVRIKRSDLDAWLDGQRIEPGSLAHLRPGARGA